MHGCDMIEVAPDVWAWVQQDGTWWINNAGLVAGPDGAVLIDTCATRERTEALLDAVRIASAGVPLRWAVNTHAHGDHTHGNCLLPDSTTLISHPGTRALLREDVVIHGCPPLWDPVPDWGSVTTRLPDLTIADHATVFTGGLSVDLHHPGFAAHTTGDMVAYVPERAVMFAGDLVFAGITPLVFMGSIEGARTAIDWLCSFPTDVLVPGHGPVLRGTEIGPELARHRDYYDFLLEVGADALARGIGPLQAAREADLGAFAGFADAERIAPNLHRYFADHGGPGVDPVAALGDAVAYRGGPMSTHV